MNSVSPTPVTPWDITQLLQHLSGHSQSLGSQSHHTHSRNLFQQQMALTACMAARDTLVGRQSALTLQPFLDSSQDSKVPRQVAAGLSVLWAFCGVATGLALVQELNLH